MQEIGARARPIRPARYNRPRRVREAPLAVHYAKHYRQSLFRYRPFDRGRDLDADNLGYLANLLRDRVLYVPRIGQFNDPWDTAPAVAMPSDMSDEEIARHLVARSGVAFDGSTEEAVKVALASLQRHGRDAIQDELRRVLKEQMRNACVLCFSSDAETPLLWSYYAAGHTGYVVEFSCTDFPLAAAVKVTYDVDYPRIDPFRMTSSESNEALLVKGDFWRHEREWRLVVPRQTDRFDYVKANDAVEGVYIRLPEGSIKSITAGLRMGRADLQSVQNMAAASNPPIDFYIEEIYTREYRVRRRLIEPPKGNT
jgi:hypothetical protein